jgi:DNA-binding CsgD family transcriptional regulator
MEAVSDLSYAPWLHDFGDVYPTAARIAADRAERARARGEGDASHACEATVAERAVARLDAMLATFPPSKQPPRPVACRWLTAAETLRAAGRSDPSAWGRAADEFRGLNEPYTLAYAAFRGAEAILAQGPGRIEDAVALLEEAWNITGRLGEQPLHAEIEALAERSRIRLGASADERPDVLVERGITPREQEVLTLLAEGASNRDIAHRLVISEKTASVHVSHILAKLGARNRAEAAAIASRLGAPVSAQPR